MTGYRTTREVVSLFGPDKIQQKLSEIATDMLGEHKFTSSTICISESGGCYYGASMSCKRRKQGQITIAVSFLCTWHYGVSNATSAQSNKKTQRWIYGHCAEAESLSKLLYKEKEIEKEVAPVEHKMREQVMKE
ncbi:unnamed protein product, partial [Coregonus sp. 'balchen']